MQNHCLLYYFSPELRLVLGAGQVRGKCFNQLGKLWRDWVPARPVFAPQPSWSFLPLPSLGRKLSLEHRLCVYELL